MSHQEILEACVVGKPDPKMMGDLATALVVKNPSSNLTSEELLKLVNGKFFEGRARRHG